MTERLQVNSDNMFAQHISNDGALDQLQSLIFPFLSWVQILPLPELHKLSLRLDPSSSRCFLCGQSLDVLELLPAVQAHLHRIGVVVVNILGHTFQESSVVLGGLRSIEFPVLADTSMDDVETLKRQLNTENLEQHTAHEDQSHQQSLTMTRPTTMLNYKSGI